MGETKHGTVQLKVNDQEIAMNPFVETVFRNVIMGMIDALDKIPPDPEKIEIQISN